MSEHLEANSPAIQKAESDLKTLTNSLEYQLAQAAVDAAGIVDPTPISDAVGGIMSLASGDFIGAGLSVVSMFPYLGDALGKTAKGARLLKKIDALRKRAGAAKAYLNNLKSAARKKAAEAVRAKRKAEAAKKAAANANCVPCKESGNRFGVSKLPDKKRGKWLDENGNPAERGNGRWHPDPVEDKKLYDSLPDGKKYIEYKEGYPDFSPHAIDRVEIDMKGSSGDFTAANNKMKEKYGDSWRQPEGTTWHHKEDGTTMELVPTTINKETPHDGGASISKDPGY